METLSEFLKHEENQKVALERIRGLLRNRNEWGMRGLFAKIGEATGLSPAYVGRILSGKQILTDTFIVRIAKYLGVKQNDLRGEKTGYQEVIFKVTPDDFENLKKAMKMKGYTNFTKQSVSDFVQKMIIDNTSKNLGTNDPE